MTHTASSGADAVPIAEALGLLDSIEDAYESRGSLLEENDPGEPGDLPTFPRGFAASIDCSAASSALRS